MTNPSFYLTFGHGQLQAMVEDAEATKEYQAVTEHGSESEVMSTGEMTVEEEGEDLNPPVPPPPPRPPPPPPPPPSNPYLPTNPYVSLCCD